MFNFLKPKPKPKNVCERLLAQVAFDHIGHAGNPRLTDRHRKALLRKAVKYAHQALNINPNNHQAITVLQCLVGH